MGICNWGFFLVQSPKQPLNLSLLLPLCDKDVWTRPGLHETHDVPICTPLFRHSELVRKPSLYKIDNTENKLLDTGREGDGGTNWESSIETYTLPYVKLDSQGEFAVWCRELKSCAHWQPRRVGRGGKGWEVGGRFKMEGTYVYLWLTHVVVWQKPTQYCKAIILQLKTNTFKK